MMTSNGTKTHVIEASTVTGVSFHVAKPRVRRIIPSITCADSAWLGYDANKHERGVPPDFRSALGIDAVMTKWWSTIIDVGAVQFNRFFGTSSGYRTHKRGCYYQTEFRDGEGLTAPLGPDFGLTHERWRVWLSRLVGANVRVSLYCGGLTHAPSTDIATIASAANALTALGPEFDSGNVEWEIDNYGEADPYEVTRTMRMVQTLVLAGRVVDVEPAAREEQYATMRRILFESAGASRVVALWDRQRAALEELAGIAANPIRLADRVMVLGNAPRYPKWGRLDRPDLRVREARWQLEQAREYPYVADRFRVYLTTAGLEPEQFPTE